MAITTYLLGVGERSEETFLEKLKTMLGIRFWSECSQILFWTRRDEGA